MTAPVQRTALILATAGDRRVVTGLTLVERARRVAVLAGVGKERVVVVTSAAELAAAQAQLAGQPLLVLRATDQVVAASLVQPLRLGEPGTRIARDRHLHRAQGPSGPVAPASEAVYAGALVVDGADTAALLAALERDLAGGDAAFAATRADAERVEVDYRARFVIEASGAHDLRAAIRWQYELVNKPLDAWLVRYFYRPLARPLTMMFLRTPLSPNVISIISIIFSLVGCAIAASADPDRHVLGLALLLFGGVVDANDGEVARLRLEMSKTGAWIDAMGDDMARIALLLGIGSHVAYMHPDWPVWPITLASVAMTVASLLMIYWYCIYVIHSSNNQDYTKALQIGPGVREEGERGLGAIIADGAAQIVRRDFIDLAVVVIALFHRSDVPFALLSLGSVVTIVVVIPTHLKIVKAEREKRAAAAVASEPA